MKRLASCKIDSEAMKQSFLYTCIWGMAAHAYGFLNFTISHDSLYEFLFTYWQSVWKSGLGRIFIQPYREFFRGTLTMPWLNGVLALTWIALCVYLVIQMFSVKRKIIAFFIAGIFATNVTVTSTAATFITDLDANMLALLLASAAAYLWWKWPKGFLFGIPLLAVSLGLYQSYFAVAIVLIELICIVWLLNGRGFKSVFLSGLKGVGMLLGGGGLYILLLKLTEMFSNSAVSEGTPHSISNLWTQPLTEKLPYFLKAYSRWLTRFTEPASTFPATIILLANCALFAITIGLLTFAIWKRKIKLPELLLAVVLLALIPVSSNISYMLNSGISGFLMEFAIWLVYLLPLLFLNLDIFQNGDALTACRIKGLQAVSFAMLAIFLWGNVLTANSAYLKKDLERQATLSSMTRAMSDLGRQTDYAWNETPVAFYGFDTEFETLPGFEDLYELEGMQSNSQITCDYHFAYIRYILNEDIQLCNASQYQAIGASETLKQMPRFPAEGYIQMIDGVMVVKMGS